ncbi:MAG: SMC-Scp complex subunit ScpB [Clostridia bacterium]
MELVPEKNDRYDTAVTSPRSLDDEAAQTRCQTAVYFGDITVTATDELFVKKIRRMAMAGRKTIKSAIESMMFVWGKPLDIKEMAEFFNEDRKEIYVCCKELQAEYEQEGRGIVIREVNKSFQFVTRKRI